MRVYIITRDTYTPRASDATWCKRIIYIVNNIISRARPVTFLSVTSTHVMPTFARSARNNCIPKRDTYIFPRCDAELVASRLNKVTRAADPTPRPDPLGWT